MVQERKKKLKAALSDDSIVRIARLVEVAAERRKERRQRNLAKAAAAAMPKETKAVPEIRRERGEIGMAERVMFLLDVDGKPTRTETRVVPVVMSQLERMWKRGEISYRQRFAGEKLSAAFEAVQVGVRSAMDLDRVPSGEDNRQMDALGGKLWAQFEIESALDAMGKRLSHIVLYVGVCGLPASHWAEAHRLQGRSGIDILKLGLDVLADYYKLKPDDEGLDDG